VYMWNILGLAVKNGLFTSGQTVSCDPRSGGHAIMEF